MAYETNELQGSIFKNKFKEPGSKQPDYRGEAKINGVVYDVACWLKQDKNGQNYFFTKYQIKGEKTKTPQTAGAPIAEEDLPF